jgi:hypothetical protein
MKFKGLMGSSILAMAVATPAYAQDVRRQHQWHRFEVVI